MKEKMNVKLDLEGISFGVQQEREREREMAEFREDAVKIGVAYSIAENFPYELGELLAVLRKELGDYKAKIIFRGIISHGFERVVEILICKAWGDNLSGFEKAARKVLEEMGRSVERGMKGEKK